MSPFALKLNVSKRTRCAPKPSCLLLAFSPREVDTWFVSSANSVVFLSVGINLSFLASFCGRRRGRLCARLGSLPLLGRNRRHRDRQCGLYNIRYQLTGPYQPAAPLQDEHWYLFKTQGFVSDRDAPMNMRAQGTQDEGPRHSKKGHFGTSHAGRTKEADQRQVPVASICYGTSFPPTARYECQCDKDQGEQGDRGSELCVRTGQDLNDPPWVPAIR